MPNFGKKISRLLPALLLFAACLSEARAAVYRLHVDDFIIHPIAAEYIQQGIERAEREKAEAVLIVMDTPGGLLESTRAIVKTILNANVPVIVYVAPAGARAASAGVFITLSAHVAAMAPGTHIGAAHPVQFGQKPVEPLSEEEVKKGGKPKPAQKDAMSDKILQDTVAWVKNIAQKRGRDVQWAVAAVEKSVSSTAEEALQKGVIDLTAENEEELLAKVDGRKITLPSGSAVLNTKGTAVTAIGLNWRQAILNILINPNIAYILLTLGFYGLLFEITHPGSWFPGVAGLICLLLAFYSFHMIPTDYAGVILTVVGLLLFGAEIFVTSYGMLALGGVVCLFFGALFLVDQPAEIFSLSLAVAIPTIAASLAIFALLMTLVLSSHRRQVATGAEGMVGQEAVAATDIAPTGKVAVHGEIWNAAAKEAIQKGERVQIVRVENLRLYVRKHPS